MYADVTLREKKSPVIWAKALIWLGFWRRVRDSNPRDLSVYSISSAAPSTTRTTLRIYFRPVFFPEICSKIRWRENRRDGKKYSILRFSVLRNIKENQGDEIPSFCRNFESVPLWPLRYRSVLQTQQSFADIITAGRAKIKPGFFSCTNLWLA